MDTLTPTAHAALGNPQRLSIYRQVRAAGAAGMSPSALMAACALPASTVSGHLTRLTAAGMVWAEKSGVQRVYRAGAPSAQGRLVFLSGDAGFRAPLAAALAGRIGPPGYEVLAAGLHPAAPDDPCLHAVLTARDLPIPTQPAAQISTFAAGLDCGAEVILLDDAARAWAATRGLPPEQTHPWHVPRFDPNAPLMDRLATAGRIVDRLLAQIMRLQGLRPKMRPGTAVGN